MTRKEAIDHIKDVICENNTIKPNIVVFEQEKEALYMAIKALEQKPSRDMEEIKEVINCDADAETKCKMISNILTAKSHYFEEPFDNRPCISSGVCEHDKQKVLDKIKAEIEQLRLHKAEFLTNDNKVCIDSQEVLNIIDKYKGESEG